MSKEKRRVPKLRFPGFTEDWEQRKLTSFTQRVKGNDGRMDLPTLTISASEGWLNQKDRFSANSAGSEQKNYTLLRQGELSYNHGNSKLAKYGVVYALKDYKEALVPRVYHSFRVDESYDALFVEYYFSTKRPDRELGKLVSSGARMDGLLNIGYDEFTNISISVPTFSEQKQIVALLKVCDKYITLHQRKLNNLKLKKKALLQKLFPKNGERYPELRFPGFTDAWEQRKLESLFTKYEDKVSTPDSGYWRLGLRSHCKGTFYTYVDAGHELETTEMYRVKAGNFILNITFAWERALAVTDDEDQGKLVSHRFPQFKPNDDLVIDFFKHTLMDKRFKHHLELSSPGGAGRNKVLKVSDMLKYELLVPSIQEQNIISSFLNNVDYIITLHQRKLDHLQLQKKALLQQMFV